MTQYIEVKTTVDSAEEAEKIANSLISRKLAGCIQIIGPVKSVYTWQGKTETATEWVCVAKTRTNLFSAIEGLIKEIHPYDLPEVIATPISLGSNEYLDWLEDSLRK